MKLVRIAGTPSNPVCSKSSSVPPATGANVNVTRVSICPPRHDQTIRRGVSSSRTSQCTTPSKPGAGSVRKLNRWPTRGAKSFGISHAARDSLEVNASQTRSGGWG